MSDLADEVRESFTTMQRTTGKPDNVIGPVGTFQIDPENEIVPGLLAMRAHQGDRIKAAVRRGYRHFAGSPLPKSSDDAFELTKEKMASVMTSLMIEVFCDGVQVGEKKSHAVQMALFYNTLEELFRKESFSQDSLMLALEITRDHEVQDLFTQVCIAAVSTLGHITGFAHSEGVSHKIWDLWLLSGTSAVTSSYIAGFQLGSLWSEREVIADLEEGMDDKSE